MTSAAKLGLGTVQFGLDYGVTNRTGRVGEDEARRIMRLAIDAGIDSIDTAHDYGESEQVLGRVMPDAPLRIVTKTPGFAAMDDPADAAAQLVGAFRTSLERLRVERVHGLLLHHPADLLGAKGAALWEACERLRSEGLVSKLGFSAYNPHEIDQALDRFPVTMVQLPFNALDDRLAKGGQLARLAGRGVEVHARSIFLQGLLLQSPDALESRFRPLADALGNLERSCREVGLSRLEGLLALIFARPEITRVLVGVTSVPEFEAILAAAERAGDAARIPDFTPPAIDALFLNPSRWNELPVSAP
jgi:aryl-alcohol dehydrogenase-like predicted oxidoreductase